MWVEIIGKIVNILDILYFYNKFKFLYIFYYIWINISNTNNSDTVYKKEFSFASNIFVYNITNFNELKYEDCIRKIEFNIILSHLLKIKTNN